MRLATVGAAVVAWLVVSLAAAQPPSMAPARFYFGGDGSLDLYNAHFDEHLTVRYRDASGRYDDAAHRQIERFFRSRSDGRSGPIAWRLIELVDFIQDRFTGARMTLVSGYRSPSFNAALRRSGRRVAEASLHTEGLAADLQPVGLDLRHLWLELRELRVGGVGLYEADGFIHVDTGRPRFWEAATSGVEKHLSAGNARIFARTDFDRYADLRDAVITLHGVTQLPIRIARRAHFDGQELILAPTGGTAVAAGDCFVISEPAAAYAFAVTTAVQLTARRTAIELRTCTPRVGATPATIATNDVEALASN